MKKNRCREIIRVEEIMGKRENTFRHLILNFVIMI